MLQTLKPQWYMLIYLHKKVLEKANAFIDTMYAEGGLYDQIREEYDVIVGEFMKNDELGLDFITQSVDTKVN